MQKPLLVTSIDLLIVQALKETTYVFWQKLVNLWGKEICFVWQVS